MSDSSPRSILDRLLGASLVALGSALALHWAWALLRPLLPIILGFAVVGCSLTAIVRVAMRRREYW
jgi:hypothetical protein